MFGYLMVAVCLCFGMASCSEDEESGAGSGAGVEGNAAAKLGDNSFSVPYGYWWVHGDISNPASNGKKHVYLEFSSLDPHDLPNIDVSSATAHMVLFSFDIPEDADGLPSIVLKGGEYEIDVVYGVTMYSEGIQCETDDENNTEGPDLIIERNGDTYNVRVENAKVIDLNKGEGIGREEYSFSFNYSGKLRNEEIPDGGF